MLNTLNEVQEEEWKKFSDQNCNKCKVGIKLNYLETKENN